MSSADIKSFKASGVIASKTLVKFTANRGEVAQATGPTDRLAGVCDLGGASGQVVDVVEADWYEVTAGAAIAAGEFFTSDANGRAVPVVKPGAGVNAYYAGRAEVPAAAGDIFRAFLTPGVLLG